MVQVVVASRHGSPSQAGRARSSLLTLRHVVRRDVMTDGKEHVLCDIGLAGLVLPDDVGDDQGKVTKSYARRRCDHPRLSDAGSRSGRRPPSIRSPAPSFGAGEGASIGVLGLQRA